MMHRRGFLQLVGRRGGFLGAAPQLQSLAQSKKAANGPATLAVNLDSGWLIATDPHNVGREQAWGESTVHHEMQIKNHQLRQLDDPCLYRLQARLQTTDGENIHEASSCFGFRDSRVVDGYFRLNGRRIFLKSTHTGNHVPLGQMVPPPGFPDLLRRDLQYAKASGFNMVRYISGLGYPDELSMCDELGLLVYEETLAAWLLGDSPKMKQRYESCVREMIFRDRNHPSVVIWGMLNETKDGPVFREAISALHLVRSLDETRLVLLSSGRFDGHLGVGSVSNSGS